jgi:hypothetical protein
VIFLFSLCALANDFSPDRPGYADSTGVVGDKRVQMEVGLGLGLSGGPAVVDAPELLLRGGLGQRWELRLLAPNLALVGGEVGVEEPAVGAKMALLQDRALTMSIVPMLQVPLQGSDWDLSTGFNWSWEINEVLGLSGNLAGTAGSSLSAESSVALNFGIGEAVGAYGEAVWLGEDQLGGGLGLGWLLGEDSQVDASVLVVGGDPLATALGAGFAHRF